MTPTPQNYAMLAPEFKGGLTMLGRIYPTQTGYRVKFQGIYKRFKNLQEAERFLNRLRHEYDQGTFDKRDWLASKPLGFSNLVDDWLAMRTKQVRCPNNLVYHMDYATAFFQNTNIKNIQYSELEAFYLSLPGKLSEKTKANVFTTLHSFFAWIIKREKRNKRTLEWPEFPTIPFELRRRPTISREQQLAILDWLRQAAPHKVWLAIKWLITYPSIRPGELIEIKEGDINRELGVIYVRDNKGKRTKTVPVLDIDRPFIRNRALSYLFFFRHEQRRGIAPHQRGKFGKRCLYTWWQKSCRDLGIRGIDLYGGTRHSTVQWLRLQGRTPEEIKRATMHSTTKSFDRYFDMDLEDLREIYAGTRMAPASTGTQNNKIVNLHDKTGRHDGI